MRIIDASARAGKRLGKIAVALIAILAVATVIVVWRSGDDEFQYAAPDTIVNDVTGLNPVRVERSLRPNSVAEVAAAVRGSVGPISIGGGRFSQGGQVAYPASLHLDMRNLDEVIALDVAKKTVTVQSGITWRKLQEAIDPHDLAIRIMQTYSNFTVGGSLSVNVHGRYIGEGPLVRAVDSIVLVLADGSVVRASPTQNPQIFYGAIGGYGGLGVIVEATLQLTDNARIQRKIERMPAAAYSAYFRERIRDQPDVVFHNADIYPPEFEDVRDETWRKTELPVTIDQRLIPTDREYVWGPRLAEIAADYDLGKWLRRHVFDPLYYTEQRVVWRNWEASYDIRELEPPDRRENTYGLREYFVPVGRFDEFLPRMREIFRRHDANILNISIRHALPDPGTVLAWAREEVFAFVVYYRQNTDAASRKEVASWTREMVDAVVAVGGTYYLPYQSYATPAQFEAAYPRSTEYFALKAQLDPTNRFRNELWALYYPPNRDALRAEKEKVRDYYRGEEQTFLTIPEWYLVFNPDEYADFLDSGKNPSDFPFFASIDEYWTLYDRVTRIADGVGYAPNAEYQTMLNVIGISTTLEYLVKGSWENTVGRLTRFTAGGRDTPEDLIIRRAHRAYSDLIYIEPWYRFPFWSWVRSLWGETDFFGADFARKLERKIAFTLEFGIKAIYAKLIGFASESAYGESEKLIYATAELPPDAAARLPSDVTIAGTAAGKSLLAIPRWGGFTRTVPQLASLGTEFVDISGNRWMTVSVLGPANDARPIPYGEEVLRSRVVSNPTKERRVILVGVDALDDVLDALPASGLELEHLYDY